MEVRGAEFQLVTIARGHVDVGLFGSLHAQPASLHFEIVVQFLILRVHMDRRAGQRFELGRAADVIDVGVRNDDRLDLELAAVEDLDDRSNVVTGIDDNRLAGSLVAKNGAVALEHANADDLVNHESLLWNPIL